MPERRDIRKDASYLRSGAKYDRNNVTNKKEFKPMINMFEVNETNKMIDQENLDVRTITLGISLLDCIDSDL